MLRFSQNVDRKGNAERRQHHASSLEWFDFVLGEGQLGKLTNVSGRRRWPTTTQPAGRRPWCDTYPAVEESWVKRTFGGPLPWINAANTSDGPSSRLRPDLSSGARFGPFRFVAEWLVRTESLSLVAIVGLFGFGLLGFGRIHHRSREERKAEGCPPRQRSSLCRSSRYGRRNGGLPCR